MSIEELQKLFPLGTSPSPWDNKRLLYMLPQPTFKEAEALPAEYDGLAPYVKCLGSQGEVGSCTGWAGSGVTKALVRLHDGFDMNFSAGNLYWHSRSYAFPPMKDEDEGSQPLSIMKQLTNCGVPPEEYSPTCVTKPFVLNDKSGWMEEANKYRILSYHAVPINEASMKAAIYGVTFEQPYLMPDGTPGKCPLYVCIPVYTEFYDAAYTKGVTATPQLNGRIWGYHAVIFRGWKIINGKPYWILVNSWGTGLGDYGLWYLPMDYPIIESWMVTDDEPGNIRPQKRTNWWSNLISIILKFLRSL